VVNQIHPNFKFPPTIKSKALYQEESRR